MSERTYFAIDLKSFYASVECNERGLNPLTTNLVVADESRTEKTICLAVSPSLKAYGISGRARLFEVVERVREINTQRLQALRRLGKKEFSGKSANDVELRQNPELALDYIVAVPRMGFYVQYSTKIYDIYLKYIAPEDIHVYSIDEVMMDVTDYLKTYGLTAPELTRKMIRDVLAETGITATAGIGTNLYLCKVAMDIVAKHVEADLGGVRIAQLDERSYRKELWTHRPLTDFWRVGRGYARKLEAHGLYTMGDIARCSLGGPTDYYNEDLLYKLFGVNAELLIDHAWGWEPCRIADIKAYRPETNSVGSGQVLSIGSMMVSLVVAVIVSIYLLLDRERYIAQCRKLFFSVSRNKRFNDAVLDAVRQTDRIFSGFISGKLVDSLIVGVICFVCLTLLRMPYALLVSVIVGVTNIIPMFGPFIGAVPSAFLILLVSPAKCVIFIIFVVVLQQVDGNIIGPRILGNSTGLSALYVTVSMLLFGKLLGFLGMIVGVPLFATLYYIVKRLAEHSLRVQNLPVETEAYIVPEPGRAEK